jgi:hypothetical protein
MPEGRKVVGGQPGNRGNTEAWDDERRAALRQTLRLKREADRKANLPDDDSITARAVEEENYEELKSALYKRAMQGDPQSTKQWLEIYEAEAPVNTFNVSVEVTSYTIADKSLAKIAAAADTDVIDEIFKGLDQRFFMDEAPQTMRNLLRALREQYRDWARIAYEPKD